MEVVAIHEGKKVRLKLDIRGRTNIFAGYADDHAGDVYRFINIQTKKGGMSRDVQWLNLFWKHYKMKHNKPRKEHVGPFFDEEAHLNLEGSDSEDNTVDGDENNTTDKEDSVWTLT